MASFGLRGDSGGAEGMVGEGTRGEETQLGETQPRAAATSWTGDG